MHRPQVSGKDDEKTHHLRKKAGKGLATYLTDWKNLLAHALLGCLLLLIAIIAPVPIWAKLILIICLVTLNILRMRWSKARNAKITGER